MKKRMAARAFWLALLLFIASMSQAFALNVGGLDALMDKKKAGAAEGGKAAALAQLTGGTQDVVVGVVSGGLALNLADEEGKPAGFDVKLVSAVLETANYKNVSFVYVEEAEAVPLLDAGEITLLMGYTMDAGALSRVVTAKGGDPVAEADADVGGETGAEEAAAPEDEGALAVAEGAGRYLRSDAYLKNKGEARLVSGETRNLGNREFYLIGASGAAKLISAFNSTFERVDIAGTKDALWMEAFETGFLFGFFSAVRRAGLNVWRQFRINLITENRYRMIFTGLGRTMLIALCAAVGGVVLGCALALMRLSNLKIGKFYYLRGIASVYVDVIRGTPVVVQLMIMYYIILNSPGISKIVVAIISFGLNSGAYVSEMVRGGILAVDKGQTEAGRSLGLSSAATMCLIVLPQTIKIIIPSLFNEIIMLLKETSVVGFIGLMDLTKAGDYIRSRTYSAFFPLLTVAAVYLVIVTAFTRLFNRVERRLRQSDIR